MRGGARILFLNGSEIKASLETRKQNTRQKRVKASEMCKKENGEKYINIKNKTNAHSGFFKAQTRNKNATFAQEKCCKKPQIYPQTVAKLRLDFFDSLLKINSR